MNANSAMAKAPSEFCATIVETKTPPQSGAALAWSSDEDNLFLLLFARSRFFDGSLGGGQSRDWHPERRAAHIGEPDAMAELHAARFATVFAADAQLDVRTRLAAQIACQLHELADTGLVDRCKRILLHDFQLLITAQERPRIIAAHAERCLGQVIGAEAEELRVFGDFIRDQGGARDFNHRADEISEFGLLLLRHFRGDSMHDL